MQTVFRLITILSLAVLLAVGMYFAGQNETVRGWLGVPTNTTQGTAPSVNNSAGAQITRPTFDGARGERGGGATNLVRNLGIFGATIFGIALVQQTTRLTRRKRKTTT